MDRLTTSMPTPRPDTLVTFRAVEKAGVNYNQHVRGGLRGWTRAKTRRALRERIENNRGSRRQIQSQAPALYRAAVHHFGSWDEAKRVARSRK